MQCMSFHHYFTTFNASYNICVAIYIIVMYLSAVQAKIKACTICIYSTICP